MSFRDVVSAGVGLLSGKPVFSLAIAEVPLRVVRFTGDEAMSSLFEFRVEAAGLDVDPEALLGKPALLTIEGADVPRLVHGLVCEAEYIGHTRHLQLYELIIAPWAHRLVHQRGCRVFQDMTTEQIITDVLTRAGLPTDWFRFALANTYAPRNYCVQYRETHLDFVNRLLEEDGIFCYYEHDEDRHVWVMADHAQVHGPITGMPVLAFNPPLGSMVQDQEHVRSFRFGGRVRPGKVTLRDKNLHRPELDLEVQEIGKSGVDLEYYDFPGEYQGPGRKGPHQGQALAKIRLEELQAMRRFGAGESDCPRLTPGKVMVMAKHPRHELNGEYRVVRVHHAGSQPQVLDQDAAGASSYENSFVVTELKVPFRPARQTPRPIMRGLQSAIVVGPEGEEVHTDAHGRVRVQFHWDREGKHDENSTTWVRVSQIWAGNGYGAMFLPRIGHEVLVDFLEGDPDRPIIVGRIYHGQNETPYPLPDEKTKSTIKSDSSPGGGGSNELRFEDRKGSEEIYLHAQKDWTTKIENSLTETVGAERSATIGGSDSTTVGADRSATIGKSDSATVGTTHSVTIAQGEGADCAPTGSKMEDKFYSVTSGKARVVLNEQDIYIFAEGNVSISAGGNVSISAGGEISIESGEGDVVARGPKIHLNPPG